MRIIFVRHGHPNYNRDCLTELGHRQAEAAAIRLHDEKVKGIYASTMGRAMETAAHIAAKHDMEVVTYDFMREVHWGTVEGERLYQDGHPWFVSDKMVEEQQRVFAPDWMHEEPFCRNLVVSYVEKAGETFDRWLSGFGYRREGTYYRVEKNCDDTVIMVSHAGVSSAVLSRLLNLPFPFLCAAMPPDFTAITVLSLSGDVGRLISPKVEILNDARHIANISTELVFG